MLSEGLMKALKMLFACGRMSFTSGATEEQIRAFEEREHVRLPSLYKEWLAYSDGGYLFLPGGIQLYGVGKGPFVGMGNRRGVPDDCMVIGVLMSGGLVLMKKDGGEVSVFYPDGCIAGLHETYPDFLVFLMAACDMYGIRKK